MKVLCVQSPRTGIEKAELYVSELAEEIKSFDFDLLVLPEKWISSKISPDDDSWISLLKMFSEISTKSGGIVVPGSFSVKRGDGLFNSAPVFINGELKGFQDKISLYKIENGNYSSGNSIQIFGNEKVKFAVPVCYDLDFPYFSKIAVESGADFLVNPSLISKEFAEMWYIYVRGRSLENRLPVISVNSMSDPFHGGSIVTRMHPESGGIFLESEIMDSEHYRLVETNSTDLRKYVRSRKNEDFGEYGFRKPE